MEEKLSLNISLHEEAPEKKRLLEFEQNIAKGKKYTREDLGF